MFRTGVALLLAGAVVLLVAAGCDYSGCWVRIYEDDKFSDDRAEIHGPGRWASLKHLPGGGDKNWDDEIESLEVGPNALVVLYKDKHFHGPWVEFGPDSRISDLDDYNFDGKASSMKIKYVKDGHHHADSGRRRDGDRD